MHRILLIAILTASFLFAYTQRGKLDSSFGMNGKLVSDFGAYQRKKMWLKAWLYRTMAGYFAAVTGTGFIRIIQYLFCINQVIE